MIVNLKIKKKLIGMHIMAIFAKSIHMGMIVLIYVINFVGKIKCYNLGWWYDNNKIQWNKIHDYGLKI